MAFSPDFLTKGRTQDKLGEYEHMPYGTHSMFYLNSINTLFCFVPINSNSRYTQVSQMFCHEIVSAFGECSNREFHVLLVRRFGLDLCQMI